MRFLFKFIAQILTNWIDSFNNDKKGFSARKEAAFGAFVVAVYLSYKFTTPSNLIEVLMMWLIYGLLCLGIITLQQVAELKSGKSQKQESVTTTTSSSSSSESQPQP